MQTVNHCKSCSRVSKPAYKQSKSYSWLPAILVAILPKCPFCIMAYTGAISMCSGNNLYPNAGSYFSYITLALAFVVLAGIALNRKGKKTRTALLIALIGCLLVLTSQFLFLSSAIYYIGTVLLFWGIWYNGSFSYFYKRYFSKSLKPN